MYVFLARVHALISTRAIWYLFNYHLREIHKIFNSCSKYYDNSLTLCTCQINALTLALKKISLHAVKIKTTPKTELYLHATSALNLH